MMKKLLLVLLLSTLLYPKSQALIIGVNNRGLKGAVNDAKAIKRLMVFQGVNVKLLLNEEATKKNIINNLKRLITGLNRGDRFYFFFSGHGTSLLDPNFGKAINSDKRLISLLENSGGLIPWDFEDNQAFQTLISAKRDLAPIFREIDKHKAFGMIMIDACFSGMSFKGFNTDVRKSTPIKLKLHFNNDAYPYKNVLYLASTAMSDLGLEDMSRQPYRGYFSRRLESCLYRTNSFNTLSSCIKKVKQKRIHIPQSAVSYPRYHNKDFRLFTSHRVKRTKDIMIVPKTKNLVHELFSLAIQESSDIEMFATQRNEIERRVYTPSTPLDLKFRATKEGYLVFMSFGEDEKSKLHYPKYEPKKLLDIEIELEANSPFGDEYLMAFLVDLKRAKKFVEIYKKNQGNLVNDASIREVMELLKGQSGSSLKLRSTK